MQPREIKTAVLIGAGNLGWHIGHALFGKGIRILQVISRSGTSSRELAGQLDCRYDKSVAEADPSADLIMLAVPDREVPGVISQLTTVNSLLVHTAGSVPMDVFRGKVLNYGVFYPLMTFTRERPVDFKTIPVLVEANSAENTESLRRMAGILSEKVHVVHSGQRKIIHLAAVIACNFSNHMYTLAENLLVREGIPFDLLMPLIAETAGKIRTIPPQLAQTGPAIRKDDQTMEQQLLLLKEDKQVAELYRIISESILTFATSEQKDRNDYSKENG